MIFDTHAHYDDEAFDNDREALIRSLPEAGIGRVVNIAASPESIEECLDLAHILNPPLSLVKFLI